MLGGYRALETSRCLESTRTDAVPRRAVVRAHRAGVYRLARRGAELGRVEGRTLDLLCDALDWQPGDLLEHVPGKQRGERRKRRAR